MDSTEQWLPVPGYEGAYDVSTLGRVRSLERRDSRGRTRREKILSPRKTTRDHFSVALYADGIRRDFQVHHLVLGAFIGPCPEGMEGCHRNDDPADNRLANLRWDTRSSNQLDSVSNGTHHVARRTHCPQGHEYTDENTYRSPSNRRVCRECRRAYREAHREERREKGREYVRRRRRSQAGSVNLREAVWTVDISDTLAPTSEQLDAVDLLSGPRTFSIERVSRGNAEQPVQIYLAEFPRPWRPGKSMRRVLVACWGADASKYVGRRVTLYCDPNVTFGKDKVGGTRIRALSHIDKRKQVPLLISRGKSATYTVEPLTEPARPAPATSEPTAEQVAATTDIDELKGMWRASSADRRTQIEARVAELTAGTSETDNPGFGGDPA